MTIVENRLKTVLSGLMKEKSVTSSQLARATGVVQPVVYRIASGETDNPKIKTVAPIAKYFDVSIDQLLGFAPYSPQDSQSAQKPASKIPMLTWPSSGQLYTQHTKTIHTNLSVGPDSFALVIPNDNLAPKFKANMIAIFDPTIPAQTSDYLLLKKEDSYCIRQLLIDGNEYYLTSLNPNIKTIQINHLDDITIAGVLVELVESFKKPGDHFEHA